MTLFKDVIQSFYCGETKPNARCFLSEGSIYSTARHIGIMVVEKQKKCILDKVMFLDRLFQSEFSLFFPHKDTAD